MKLPHLSRFWHGVSQAGLTALQVGNIATKFLPFPWNLAAGAGIALTQGLLALHHHQPSPSVFTILDLPAPKG